jgi:peptidoglycan/LPS O-acetylase OafA/YrhL
MKKSLIVFLVAGLVLISMGLWFFSSVKEFKMMDLFHFGVITLIVGFAVFVGLKRLRSEKRGEPVEDELSKKILQKTAAISYYISLYIWVFLIFLKDRVKFETEELLGTGILAMAVTFGIAWLILNFKGIKND